MTSHKGIALIAVLLIIGVLAVLGGGAYVVLNPHAASEPRHAHEQQTNSANTGAGGPLDSSAAADAKTSISWKLTDMDFDANNTPHTEVTAVVNGTEYVVGTFEGTCSEIGASGGVDGKGLLAGELSAVQCWFAGGGDEIGVFAHEDGGYQIMAGILSEPDGEGSTGFRGDFKIKKDITSTIPAGAI